MRYIYLFYFFLGAFFLPATVGCNTEQKQQSYTPTYDLTDADGNIIDVECTNPLAPNAYKQPQVSDWPTIRDMKMGAVYNGINTTFQVFAPTAQSVEVVLYDTADQNLFSPTTAITMARDGDGNAGFGVWSTTQATSIVKPAGSAGAAPVYYRYRINCMYNYDNKLMKERERYISDPYSLASAGAQGPSIVMDTQWKDVSIFDGWDAGGDADVGPGKWFDDKRPSTSQYIVYEMHIDDFTGSNTCLQSYSGSGDTCKNKLGDDALAGKYAGAIAMSDHLATLGINAVHIMPLHESSSDSRDNPESYSWGYLPALFFAPESSYSSYCERGNANESCTYNDAKAGYQALELKRLIKTLHSQGIAVILDVVLNHTSNAFNYLYQIEPYGRYYFRTNGLLWNNIGTGNQIFDDRVQRPFAYKLILDNIKYWVKHYHVDGFRFDLAVGTSEGMLRDIQNMINGADAPASWNNNMPPESDKTSLEINGEFLRSDPAETPPAAGKTKDNFNNEIKLPNFMTGENWMGATRHGFMVQSNWATPNFAGQLTGDYRGFSQWNDYFREGVKKFIQGNSDAQWTSRAKTAMYFSKNRDDGIWQAVSKNPVDTLNYIESHDEESVARAVLDSKSKAAIGMLLLLTSHGTPMLYEGQEFMRNKQIQDQSKTGNNLDWQLAVNNADFLDFTATLIKLRKACPALHYGSDPTDSNSNFDSSSPNQTISFFSKGGVCSGFTGTEAGYINGKGEFRILANTTASSQSFTIETGGGNWRAVAAVTGGNDNTNCNDQNSAKLRWVNGTGDNLISGWGTTSLNWSLPCYSAVILVKQ